MRWPWLHRKAASPDSGPYVVYTMASDAMLAYAVVFLESFRRYNPSLPLRIIPFDTCAKVAPLAARYGASMVQRDFADVDALVNQLFDEPIEPAKYNQIDIRRRLRKLIAFESQASEFLYMDLDSIVLANLDVMFGHIEAGRAELIYTLGGGDYVYRGDSATLPPTGIRIADGCFVSSSRHLNFRQICQTLTDDRAFYKAVRHPFLISQPLVNFVCHRRGVKLAWSGDVGVNAIDLDIGPLARGQIFRNESGDAITYEGNPVLRAHWAGPEKYRGQLAYKDIANGFIADAVKNGRLLEREAAALSFAIGA